MMQNAHPASSVLLECGLGCCLRAVMAGQHMSELQSHRLIDSSDARSTLAAGAIAMSDCWSEHLCLTW